MRLFIIFNKKSLSEKNILKVLKINRLMKIFYKGIDMRRGLNLGRYIPDAAKEVSFDDVLLKVYVYGSKDDLSAIAYKGKSNKALWHYKFKSEERRDYRIEETYKSLLNSKNAKEERNEERKIQTKEFLEGIEVGDIFYGTWGWEQTNVYFYKCTNLRGSTIELTPIGDEIVEDTGMDQGYRMPMRDSIIVSEHRPIISKRITTNYIKVSEFIRLNKWNGNKVWSSWYY